jgi:hypothetical protein
VLWEAEQVNKGKLNEGLQSQSEYRKRGYKGGFPKSNKRSRNGGGFQKGNGKGGNGRNTPGDNDDKSKHAHKDKNKNPCKFHNGIHPWAECFGNKNGKNYKEGFVLPEMGKWTPKANRHDNGRHDSGDAHHADTHRASQKNNTPQDTPPTNSESHWADQLE